MRKKSILGLVLLTFLLFFLPTQDSWAMEEVPPVESQAFVLMDAQSGEVLFEKNQDATLAPASLTKILTAILVLEELDLEKVVTVDPLAAEVGGATMALQAGEQLTVEQLLNGMLIASANDAAVALAIEIAGSEEDFALMMNEKAWDLGATDSYFVSANGLTDDPKHQTTATDLALLTKVAMENEIFADIVQKETYEMGATNLSPPRILKTTNKLLYDEENRITVHGKSRAVKYEYAIGAKTGTTDLAGYCLAAVAQKEETTLIAIGLKAEKNKDRYQDSIQLLEYGFNHFHSVKIMDRGESCGAIKVKHGRQTTANTSVAEDIIVTLPIEGTESVTETEIIFDKKIQAPIKKGTKVGVVEVYEGDQKIKTVDVVIDETIEKGGPWTALYISDFMALMILLALVILLLLLLVIRQIKRRNRRKRALLLRKERAKRKERLEREQADKQRRNWPY